MKIVFCEDPLRARKVDEVYQPEADAITALGLKYSLVNFETLVNAADPEHSVNRVLAETEATTAVYRGWMLRPDQYAALYTALNAKGLRLLNDPAAYQHCHYLPESYGVIASFTPLSVWLPLSGDLNMEAVMTVLAPFGTRPVIVKDFVKSQKHYWAEACYIPSAADRSGVERVVRRFLELQGDYFNQGLVFREFVDFQPLAAHSKSGMPLSKEFRVFVLDGEPLYVVDYWEEGDYAGAEPVLEPFRAVMRQVQSRFYTMDIAQRADGGWMIVELGDAQVAGLPDNADLTRFYRALTARMTG